MKRDTFGYVAAIGLVLLSAVVTAVLLFGVQGCSAQVRRDTSSAIVRSGPALGAITEANRVTYTEARDALALGLRANGGTREMYLEALAPMSAEFNARSQALEALNRKLVEAAALLDATRDQTGAQESARAALLAWQDALDVLGSGDVLPPVPVPPSVRAVLFELSRLVHPGDAGGE